MQLVASLVERWRQLIGVAFLAATLSVVLTLVAARKYESRARFVPIASGEQLSGLASLAGQFGFQLPGAGTSFGPEFYLELLGSQEVLRSVVASALPAAAAAESGAATYEEVLEADGDTPAERMEDAVERLWRDHMRVDLGRETGIVTFGVTTKWPAVSLALAEEILRQVERFNIESQQALAKDERVFLEARVKALRSEHDSVERVLRVFLERNREYASSPLLQVEHDRLERDVLMRQQVLTGVMEAFEAARIKEVRNTRAVAMVESPQTAARPLRRGTLGRALLGGILGAALFALFTIVSQSDAWGSDPQLRRIAAVLKGPGARR